MSKRPDNVRFALRIATFGWAAITLIHFTIWALTSIIGGGLDYPWWLWFAVPPGVVLGGLWWLLGEAHR
jgi:hypothetical protein